MLARCIGPRVLSAMLCVRFAQSMARHSTQVKQAFLYRVFWAVRWAMKPRGCSKSTTRVISSRRLTTHHISRSASTSMVSRFSTVWCTPKCGLVRSLSSFCYRSMQRCAPTFQSACQSISCCMSATHWMCDACGESTRMTTIIESFPTNGPKPSELWLPAWTSTKIDRQRSPSRPRSSSTISNAGRCRTCQEGPLRCLNADLSQEHERLLLRKSIRHTTRFYDVGNPHRGADHRRDRLPYSFGIEFREFSCSSNTATRMCTPTGGTIFTRPPPRWGPPPPRPQIGLTPSRVSARLEIGKRKDSTYRSRRSHARFLDRHIDSNKISHAALLLLMLEVADADLVSPSA